MAVTIDNSGSTTFDPAAGYRIGLAPGVAGWTPERIELDGPLDPGRTTTQTLSLVPGDAATPLRLQLVRDGGPGGPGSPGGLVVFGRPTEALPAPVPAVS